MELKYLSRGNRESGDSNVLIVPLWNWNIPGAWEYIEAKSFNRTFMELK